MIFRSAHRNDPFRGSRPLFATCDAGLENLLKRELQALGAAECALAHRGVHFAGDKRSLWRVNLGSRFANRVLLPVAEFPALDRKALYDGVHRIQWPTWFGVRRTLAVDASTHKNPLAHSGFVAQVVKDAICDRFREQFDARPSVDRKNPDIVVNARLHGDRCVVSLCSSGQRLHRRGYRIEAGPAPLKETLAAAMVTQSGWTPGMPLVDPMCGAGTIVIEAALMAAGIGPGTLRINRAGFSFMRWHNFQKGEFDEVLATLDAQMTQEPSEAMICGFDIDTRAVAMAQRNAHRAGIEAWLNFESQALIYLKPRPQWTKGFLVTNPPYGERMGEAEEVQALYGLLGEILRDRFKGFKAGILIPEESPSRALGLSPDRRFSMRNGPLPCRLFCCSVYDGPRRKSPTTAASDRE